eukprot:958526-Prymnesium_polylepis.2
MKDGRTHRASPTSAHPSASSSAACAARSATARTRPRAHSPSRAGSEGRAACPPGARPRG